MNVVDGASTGDKITYINVFSSSDVSYETTQKGIKESIIINSSNAPDKFTYKFNAVDLKAELKNDNSIVFTQISKEKAHDVPVSDGTTLPAGKASNFLPDHPTRFVIPSPIMIDANGKKSNTSDVKVILNTNSITFIPDPNWLKDAKYPVVLDPSVEAAPQITEEIAEKRTETSKTFLNNDLSYTSVMFQNPIHYQESGRYKDIDRTFLNSADPDYKYEVSTGVYKAKLKDKLTGVDDINLEFENGEIGFSPQKIKWSNGDVLGSLVNVSGQLSKDKTKVDYDSVFGIPGIDLEAIYDNEKFLKETVINSTQAINSSAHINEDFEISFVLSLPADVNLKINGKTWDKRTTVVTDKPIPVFKNDEQIFSLRQFVVYSEDGKNRGEIKVRFSRENDKLIMTKIISGKFLSDTTYPIRTDATATIFSSTADGIISSYDYQIGSTPLYSVARNGTGTLSIDTTFTGLNIGQYYVDYGGDPQEQEFQVQESFISFDSSGALINTDTVSAATLSLYPFSDNSVTDFTIEARSFDWGASVTAGDWVAGGSLSSKTLQASYTTSSGWSGAAYKDLTSDAGFPASVVKNGVTYLLLCSSRTTNNIEPTGYEYVAARSADQTGTSQDPKLTVTYTAGGATDTPTNTPTPTSTPTPTLTPTPTVTPTPKVKIQGGVRIQGGTRL